MSTKPPIPPKPSNFDKDYYAYCLELEKFAHSQGIDTTKLESERKSRRWTIFATLIAPIVPVILLIGGFLLNNYAEREKDIGLHKDESKKQRIALRNKQIEFIDKQLSEFYYPIRLGLDKYVVLNQQIADKKNSEVNGKWAKQIERDGLIPNHKKIIEVIDAKFHLIKNSFGDEEVEPLIEIIKKYQLHVASYSALRETGDDRNPGDVYAGYPGEFNQAIASRISSLLKQQRDLEDKNRQDDEYK